MKQFHIRWTFRSEVDNSLIQVDEYGFKRYMRKRYNFLITQNQILTCEVTTTHQHFLDCLYRAVVSTVLKEKN